MVPGGKRGRLHFLLGADLQTFHTWSFQGGFFKISNSTNVIIQSHGSSKQSQLFAACFHNPGNVHRRVKGGFLVFYFAAKRVANIIKWTWTMLQRSICMSWCFIFYSWSLYSRAYTELLSSPVCSCLFINQILTPGSETKHKILMPL